eukprot:2913143-Pleurochrysis_carterae.AAC.1
MYDFIPCGMRLAAEKLPILCSNRLCSDLVSASSASPTGQIITVDFPAVSQHARKRQNYQRDQWHSDCARQAPARYDPSHQQILHKVAAALSAGRACLRALTARLPATAAAEN